ncbi:class I SAM-dependent methyltransferase [Actinokineospora iranica]|uniref:Methyltransferase small domain-containing protein n=1 Tax=Actinokineospora iranica TaxID=1271860 RepID=A0A1G6VPX5_9PSEU|nr:hypothetical protein [Actinokineospora iranica]SDD55710.1 hypothetical protein SAMN05216174_11336 [Actinokineospora iranica]
MPPLTRDQEKLHAQACQLVDLDRDLTEDERAFVLDHWRASATTRSASDRAYFAPAGLARDMSLEFSGDRIIDLCAGIGRLAFHARDLWGHWPGPGREIVCIERNPLYVRVGRRVLPEASWICADIMAIPNMLDELGRFDCAISNPPYGAIPRSGNAPGGYRGRRFEYHALSLARLVADRAVFLIPQVSAPFSYSGVRQFVADDGDTEHAKFAAATGIALEANCGIDTSFHRDDWHDQVPSLEIVTTDFDDIEAPETMPAATRRRLTLLADLPSRDAASASPGRRSKRAA